jgi:hypothetical protein
MAMEEIVIPEKGRGVKRKLRNICKIREHDWDGFYHDGWLFLDCAKCDAKNIQHMLKPKEIRALANGWNPNRLYIKIDRAGNQWEGPYTWTEAYIPVGYLEYHRLRAQDSWARGDVEPV